MGGYTVTLLPATGYADCNDLSNNPKWTSQLTILKEQVDSKKYSEAIETSKPLFAICQESPALLYYTGLALQGNGDADRAKVYFQKASEATSGMATEPGISRLIWYARYEAENPNRTKESVEKLNAELEKYKIQDVQSSYTDQIVLDRYKATMWTGIGVGIAGIVLTSVGGALVATQEKSNDKSVVRGESLKIRGGYLAGWTTLGVGLGLAVAGAITAGIGGYQYTHLESNNAAPDGADLSFHVGLTGAEMRLTF